MTAKHTVAARLTANSSAFVAGFKAAENAAKSFNRTMTTTTMNMRESVGKMNTTAHSTGQSLNALGAGMKDYGDGLNQTAKGASSATKSLDTIGSASDKASNGLDKTSKKASWAARDLDRFNRAGRGASMVAIGLGAAMVGGAAMSMKVFADYETALTGVAKTTDASAKELRSFDLAFRRMSRAMPAGYEEIAQVAETAAQLGVQNKNIEKFTETMIRMGTSTNLSAEDAANALSRMMNIMGTNQSDVDRFASTIVKMGNVSAATEQDIVNMGMRIAGMGKALDMSESDVVALATSLSDLGVRAEMGGSAISTIMSKTASAIEQGSDTGKKWAEVMGMSIGEVKRLFKEDAYGGLIKMVEGLEKVKESGGNLDKTLRDLGINEIRQLDVMKRLTGNSHKLADAQRTANQEWQTNSALLNESARRYETFGSQVQMAWNGIKNIISNVGGALAKSSGDSMDWIVRIINGLEDLTNKFFDAKGNITQFGEDFANSFKKIAGISVVLAAVGTAFMAFGPNGAIAVAVVAGLGAIGMAIAKIIDKSGILKSEFSRSLKGLDEATVGKAEKFYKMRDGINKAMTDIRLRSANEARMTKEEILKEVDALTNEVMRAINEKENQILAINKRLVKSATGAEKEALKASVSEIKAHYEEQRNLAANAQQTITKTLSGAYSERRRLTSSEYATLSNMFSGLDKMYSTHVSKSVDDMGKLSRAFEKFDTSTSFDTVQKNVTQFAKETATAMSELNKGFEKQKTTLEASGLPARELSLHMSSLKREYDENRKSLLGNLDVYEENAKKLYKNIDATKGLSDKQRVAIETAKDLTDKNMTFNSVLEKKERLMSNDTYNHQTLAQAAKNAAKEMKTSKDIANEAAKAYLDAKGKVVTLSNAFNVIKTSSKDAATAMGEGFVSSVENGVKMVDLGSAGKMKLNEFVAGIKSGQVSVEQAALAQINAMRASMGQASLTSDGERAMGTFMAGLTNKSTAIGDTASKLGLTLNAGMKVDLGDAGVVSAESFTSGLKSGQYGAVELMAYFTNTLKTISTADLTVPGSNTMATLRAGLKSGLVSVDQVVASLDGRIKSGATINLMGEGKVTLDSLVAGLESGKYSVDVFMMGLQQLAKQSAKTDLSAEGQSTMSTFSSGLTLGLPPVMNTLLGATQQIESALSDTDGSSGGRNAMNTFDSGIKSAWSLPKASADQTKSIVEQTLGSTTDGSGGHKSGSIFASNLSAKSGDAQGAANRVKSSAENELSTANDRGAGDRLGSMFGSGVGSANAIGIAAGSASALVQSAINNLNDGGRAHSLGQFLGQGFANGISSMINSVMGAAGNLANIALSAIQRVQNSHSPAKETIKLGGDFGDGYIIAIKDKQSEAMKAAGSLAGSAISAMDSMTSGYSFNAMDVSAVGMHRDLQSLNTASRRSITSNIDLNAEPIDNRLRVDIVADQKWIKTYINEENAKDKAMSFMR